MMGVTDVKGFVQSACVCFRWDDLFDDPQGGASGTVNKQLFIDWLTLNIFPRLGNFEKGEPRSIVILSMLVFSLVVAVSTFEQRTARRYNNTHCTYGVNLQHEGSISELHCAKSFFCRAREDRTIFFAKNIMY
jgi:hypothetical protein